MKRYVYPWETGKNSLENRPSTVFFLLARFPRAIVINLNHQPREPTRTDSTTPSMYVQKGEEISENRDFWSIQKWSETVFIISVSFFHIRRGKKLEKFEKRIEKKKNNRNRRNVISSNWSKNRRRNDRTRSVIFRRAIPFSLLLSFLLFFFSWLISLEIARGLFSHTSRMLVMGSGSNLSSSQTPPPPARLKLITLNPVSSSNRFVPGIIVECSNRCKSLVKSNDWNYPITNIINPIRA